MKPKDIEVGKIYKNKFCDGAEYLGVLIQGRSPRNNRKKLIIVRAKNRDMVGLSVVLYEMHKEFWERFYLTKTKFC